MPRLDVAIEERGLEMLAMAVEGRLATFSVSFDGRSDDEASRGRAGFVMLAVDTLCALL
jgi:hypothetical protein